MLPITLFDASRACYRVYCGRDGDVLIILLIGEAEGAAAA